MDSSVLDLTGSLQAGGRLVELSQTNGLCLSGAFLKSASWWPSDLIPEVDVWGGFSALNWFRLFVLLWNRCR